MSSKLSVRGGVGVVLVVAAVTVAIALLVPGFATVLGRLVANLWVTVMSAVAGILGGLMGA